MDPVIRQTGQHIEFEAEWEGAFNLQIRLADSLVIVQDWCRSDRMVIYQATFLHLLHKYYSLVHSLYLLLFRYIVLLSTILLLYSVI